MILARFFLRWCHLMAQLLRGAPHRAIDFAYPRERKRFVLCTCGRSW